MCCQCECCCFYPAVVVVIILLLLLLLLLLLYCDLVLYHLHGSQCLYLCLRISDSMLMVFGGTGQTIKR